MKSTHVSSNGDRGAFLAEVSKLWPAAKGSVAEIHKPCVRSGCRACAEGRGHKAFILSYRDGKRRHCLYVPAKMVAIVRKAIANGRQIEQLLSRAGAQIVLRNRRNRK